MLNLEDQLADLTNNRWAIYAFLSRVYEKEMTVEFLKEISDENSSISWIKSLEELPDEELKEGVKLLNGYLKDLRNRDLEQVRLELAVEYANLFLGIKGKISHPSESAYQTKGFLEANEIVVDVLNAYWDAGVDKAEEFAEPPDHIAVELQFMAYLCKKIIESVEKGEKDDILKYIQMQSSFLTKHLSQWIPSFAKDVIKTAEADFYKALAIITKRFIELDNAFVKNLLQGMAGPDSTLK